MKHSDPHSKGKAAGSATIERIAHEDSAMAIFPLFAFAAVLAIAIVAALLSMSWLSHKLREQHRVDDVVRHPMAAEREVPPDPRLQTSPASDLALHRERDAKQLSSYGWIDRQAGVVHIPIERAMESVLQRGLLPHRADASDGDDRAPKEQ